MTDREKAIVMAYTGVTMLTGDKLGIFYEYIEELLGHPITTYILADQDTQDEITRKSKEDFIALCKDDTAKYDMDDLISRKEAMEACIEASKQKAKDHDIMWAVGLRYAEKILKNLPSIHAVPLDKLCEWLEGAEKEGLSCLECADLLRNKSFVTKWMEGLK